MSPCKTAVQGFGRTVTAHWCRPRRGRAPALPQPAGRRRGRRGGNGAFAGEDDGHRRPRRGQDDCRMGGGFTGKVAASPWIRPYLPGLGLRTASGVRELAGAVWWTGASPAYPVTGRDGLMVRFDEQRGRRWGLSRPQAAMVSVWLSMPAVAFKSSLSYAW